MREPPTGILVLARSKAALIPISLPKSIVIILYSRKCERSIDDRECGLSAVVVRWEWEVVSVHRAKPRGWGGEVISITSICCMYFGERNWNAYREGNASFYSFLLLLLGTWLLLDPVTGLDLIRTRFLRPFRPMRAVIVVSSKSFKKKEYKMMKDCRLFDETVRAEKQVVWWLSIS